MYSMYSFVLYPIHLYRFASFILWKHVLLREKTIRNSRTNFQL